MARRADPAYYLDLWNSLEIRSQHRTAIAAIARRIIADGSRYRPVESALGVAWPVVGIIHSLECGGDFTRQVLNGERWDRVTTLVPKGRGPWGSWEESAIDGLKGFPKGNEVATILRGLEDHNGQGYRHNPKPDGMNSPYLWSFTTAYVRGKFVADGVFDPEAVSKQAGAAAILWMIQSLGAWPQNALDNAQPSPVVAAPSGRTPFIKQPRFAREYQNWLNAIRLMLPEPDRFDILNVDGEIGPLTSSASRSLGLEIK